MSTRSLLISSFLLLAPGLALGQRGSEGTPSLRLPNPSGADAPDLIGLEINPAALGFVQSFALAYYGSFSLNADTTPGTGSALFGNLGTGGFSLGLGTQFITNNNRNFFDPTRAPAGSTKLSAAFGFGFGTAFAFGTTVSRFVSDGDPSLDGLASWDAGAILRPNRYLSLAAVAYDFNTPVFDQDEGGDGIDVLRLAVSSSFNFSVGARPLGNDRLTLTGDVGIAEAPAGTANQGAFETRPRFGLALQPVKGLILRGQAQFDGGFGFEGFQAGLTLNMEQFGGTSAFSQKTGGPDAGESLLFVSARATGERYPGLPVGADHIVEIPLSGSLSEKTSAAALLPGASPKTFYSLIKRLQEATEDEHIKGILFKMSGLSANAAQIEELTAAIAAFRAKGKKCYVYMDTASGREYQLATACDEIYVSPTGTVMLAGIMSQIPFYKDVYGKVGVEAQFIRIGKYKSAPESYTETQPTQENIDVREELLDDLFAILVNQIATGRKLSEEKVKELIDQGPYTASEAKKAGLIDGLEYYDELKDRLKKDTDSTIDTFSNSSPELLDWGPKPAIVVIVVDGAITKGKGGFNPLQGGSSSGDEAIVKALKYAADTSRVKAVVLRVDSPGGDALASDLIWHAVEKVKEKKKPVIVSMASVAASGGYYISAGADEIFADKSTITGSIGIFSGKFVLGGLYEKVGLHYAVFKRGAHIDWDSPMRAWTEEEMALQLTKITEFYNTFTSKVAKGRGLTQERVDELGRGRVYTGQRALGIKLVTKLGGLSDALNFAQEKAGVEEEPELMFLPKESSGIISRLLGASAKSKIEEKVEAQIEALPPLVVETLRQTYPAFLYLDPEVPWALMLETYEIR